MIDIKIMAHPSRQKNVRRILKQLNLTESNVIWDDRKEFGGAMYTARKAWLAPFPDGCSHRIVIQDDAEICNNFILIANQIVKTHPNEIISFFHIDKMTNNTRYCKCRSLPGGVAIMLPKEFILEFFDYVDNSIQLDCPKNLLNEILKADTDCLRLWMRHKKIQCITTVPSLVQHLGDISLVGIK